MGQRIRTILFKTGARLRGADAVGGGLKLRKKRVRRYRVGGECWGRFMLTSQPTAQPI